jgi:glycosyltransferase involved in cell wall biosynthesis
MQKPKLLYLGFAFPPGIAGLFPGSQPAGHLVETSLVNALRPWFEVRSVGISWIQVEEVSPDDVSPGLPHALNLLDRWPEVYHRRRSLFRLKRQYREWTGRGWTPEAILVCNFSPVFNAFIRWLKAQPRSPKVILYLADSTSLQRPLPWKRRLRYRFKPLVWPDYAMVRYVDACVAVSLSTKEFFKRLELPWLWLPNGCDPKRAVQVEPKPLGTPIRFGYIGALAPHAGLPQLLRVFTAEARASELHICGFGKAVPSIAAACQGNPQLRFYEPRTPDACIALARDWDVLVNPRPLWPGNENNFSSKVFEYALSGRAILTSAVSGVDEVLGAEAFYFEARDFEPSLGAALAHISTLPRQELRRRGAAIQQRLLTQFSWSRQGEQLAQFLRRLLMGKRA